MSINIVQGQNISGGRCCETCAEWWVNYTCGNCGKRNEYVDSGDIKFDDDFNILHDCEHCGTTNKVED